MTVLVNNVLGLALVNKDPKIPQKYQRFSKIKVEMKKGVSLPLIMVILASLSFTAFVLSGKITGQFESEQINSEEFENYTNQATGISIFYPPDWQIKKDTQIFENGDLATFQKPGPTQKASTDFNDGARLTIGNPFPEEKDAQTWAKDFYGSQKTTYSTEMLNVTSFVKVETCTGAGCQTYYHAKKNNKIYSIFVFAQGEDKLQYQILLKQALNSLTF